MKIYKFTIDTKDSFGTPHFCIAHTTGDELAAIASRYGLDAAPDKFAKIHHYVLYPNLNGVDPLDYYVYITNKEWDNRGEMDSFAADCGARVISYEEHI